MCPLTFIESGRGCVTVCSAVSDWARRLSIAGDATAQSTVYYTPFNDNIQRQDSYGLLGTRVECGPGHRRWTVGAYARNLTNMNYVTGTFGTPPTAYAGRPGPSRQFAIEFTVQR